MGGCGRLCVRLQGIECTDVMVADYTNGLCDNDAKPVRRLHISPYVMLANPSPFTVCMTSS